MVGSNSKRLCKSCVFTSERRERKDNLLLLTFASSTCIFNSTLIPFATLQQAKKDTTRATTYQCETLHQHFPVCISKESKQVKLDSVELSRIISFPGAFILFVCARFLPTSTGT